MKLNYGQTIVLGLGFFGVSVIWSIYNAFVPVFLADNFHLGPSVIAFFVTLDNIASLLIQPPVGAWSDRLRTPIGRRMPFILAGAPIAALAFGFIPLAPILPLFVLCTSTLLISMAVWRTPAMALIADVTPPELRSQASGVVSFIGGVGAVGAYLGGGALFKQNQALPFWASSVVVVAAALLMFWQVREPAVPPEAEAAHETPPGVLSSLQELWADPDKSTVFMLAALFCFMVAYTAIEGFFTLYAGHHLGIKAGDSTLLLGAMSLAFIVFAIPAGNLGSWLPRRAIIMAGLVLMAGLLLTIYLLPPDVLTRPVFAVPILGTVPILGLLLMAAGLAWALIIIHPLPMLSNMTDASRIGTYTGLYYLFSSLAAIAGPNLNGLMVQVSGGNYNMVMLFATAILGVAWGLMWGVRHEKTTVTAVELSSPIANPVE